MSAFLVYKRLKLQKNVVQNYTAIGYKLIKIVISISSSAAILKVVIKGLKNEQQM